MNRLASSFLVLIRKFPRLPERLPGRRCIRSQTDFCTSRSSRCLSRPVLTICPLFMSLSLAVPFLRMLNLKMNPGSPERKPSDYPLSPFKMRFDPPLFHPNSKHAVTTNLSSRTSPDCWKIPKLAHCNSVYPDGNVCISILHTPGDDPTMYEQASERWSPVQSVEKVILSVISMLAGESASLHNLMSSSFFPLHSSPSHYPFRCTLNINRGFEIIDDAPPCFSILLPHLSFPDRFLFTARHIFRCSQHL